MSTRTPHFILPLLLIVFLTSCGSRPTLPAASQPFVGEEVAPSPTPVGTPLRVLGPYVREEGAAFEKVLAEFVEESGVEVVYTGGSDVPTALQEALDAERVPDVVVLPKPNWLGELAGAGILAPLHPDAAAAARANYAAGWQELASYDGRLYGVPLNATSKSLVWYRPQALAAVNMGPPADWEAWLALNATLAENNLVPLAVPGGESWMLTDWFENILLRASGPEVYRGLVAREVAWTGAPVRDAFEHLGDLLRDEWLVGGRAGTVVAPLAETMADAFNPEAPAAAMALGPGWIGPFAADKHPQLALGRDLEFFPFPAISPAHATAVESYVNMAVALNDRRETMALLAFLASPEAAESWVRESNVIVPNRRLALAPSAYPNELSRREAAQLAAAETIVPDLSDTVPFAVGDALGAGLQAYLRNPAQLDAILDGIEAAALRTQGSIR